MLSAPMFMERLRGVSEDETFGASPVCARNKWRRGWDSDSILWLNPRKLLIPRNGRTAKNDQIAEVRYTAGTRSRVVEQLN